MGRREWVVRGHITTALVIVLKEWEIRHPTELVLTGL